MKQSTGRDNVQEWIHSLNQPPNYIPRIMPVKQSYWRELCDYFADGWRNIALGIGLGALMAIFIVVKFDLIGS